MPVTMGADTKMEVCISLIVSGVAVTVGAMRAGFKVTLTIFEFMVRGGIELSVMFSLKYQVPVAVDVVVAKA